MNGMNNKSGELLSGIEHLRQSIIDILTTPIGSRVMRLDYGSRLYELIDRPANPALMLDIYAATAEALQKWEPRFALSRVQIESIKAGQILIGLEGVYQPSNQTLSLEGLVI